MNMTMTIIIKKISTQKKVMSKIMLKMDEMMMLMDKMIDKMMMLMDKMMGSMKKIKKLKIRLIIIAIIMFINKNNY